MIGLNPSSEEFIRNGKKTLFGLIEKKTKYQDNHENYKHARWNMRLKEYK